MTENIFHKSFDNIAGNDIQSLIKIKYKERQTIEYKKEMYGKGDEDKREMLRDISSFANAYGGYLIIGVEEDKNGVPIKIINVENAEVERDRIEKSCLSNIEPRISGLKCKTVPIDSTKNIIIVFIPKSLKKPHMINFKGLNQFWIRHDDTKLPMFVEEIREACISVENIWKDIKLFLDEREKEQMTQMTSRGGLVIGSSPVLIREDFIDIRDSNIKKFLIEPPNQVGESYTLSFKYASRPLAYTEPTLSGLRIKVKDYKEAQLFRNGYYELRLDRSEIYIQEENKGVFIDTPSLIGHTVNYFRALGYLVEQFGIESNIVAFVNLYNIENIKLEANVVDPINGFEHVVKKKLEKTQHLLIPAKQIVSFDNPDSIAKSFLEKIWNAYGFEEVPYFEGDKYYPLY